MRSFVYLRQTLSSHHALTKELMELKSFLLKRSHKTDRGFKRVWNAIEKLTNSSIDHEQRKIGFDVS